MGTDNEIARAKWLLISVTVFLAAGCISWNEVSYLIFGRDATADVTKAYEVVRRGRFGTPGRPRLTIDYAFAEPDGTRRTGTDTVSADWAIPANGKVAVRYIPGADGNGCLAGQVHWLGLALFAVSLAAVGGFGYRLWREANEATRPARERCHNRSSGQPSHTATRSLTLPVLEGKAASSVSVACPSPCAPRRPGCASRRRACPCRSVRRPRRSSPLGAARGGRGLGSPSSARRGSSGRP